MLCNVLFVAANVVFGFKFSSCLYHAVQYNTVNTIIGGRAVSMLTCILMEMFIVPQCGHRCSELLYTSSDSRGSTPC